MIDRMNANGALKNALKMFVEKRCFRKNDDLKNTMILNPALISTACFTFDTER